MQIQISTDRHIKSDERLAEFVRDSLQNKLNRFADHITRLDVHLTDENGAQKKDDHDKRCVIEARFEGLDPVAITEHAASVSQAITGAADKMQRKLASVIGKLRDKHSRVAGAEFVDADEPA